MLVPSAQAQQPILQKGAAVVTGFPGTSPAARPSPGVDPLDNLYIDLNGASARILDLSAGGQPPQGQLIASPTTFQAKAGDVGQVFGIALDDGRGPDGALSGLPDIYLSASSAFGLQIIQPDAAGLFAARARTGAPGAQWMPGQWGDAAKGGSPGSIWKVSGATGAISLFADVKLNGQANSGPGLGNIAFDAKSRQIFVSDLSTGMIHRLDMHGTDLGYYDHGTQGRAAQGLPPSPDDPANRLKITDPAFHSEDASTWHFAPKSRQVWGLAMNSGRLYYAVAEGPQVWSVSIGQDGSFGADPRLEINVTGTPAGNAISGITFDGQGAIYLAQRGAARGDYTYKVLAESKKSALLRYHQDPKTGKWLPAAEEYAVGFPAGHRNTNGGVALGYGYDASGRMMAGSCGRVVWTTGELLRLDNGGSSPEVVHGLQGTDPSLVLPANQPPIKSYFADYDGTFNDADVAGHIGDVAIWQPCEQSGQVQQPAVGGTTPVTPGTPPIILPPDVTPPSVTPPPTGTFNLTLTKETVPFFCPKGAFCPHPPVVSPSDCVSQLGKWLCSFKIIVKNTGSTPYAGSLTINDVLPAAPASTNVTFSAPPPWTCTPGVPLSTCANPGVALNPGDQVDIGVMVDFPATSQVCSLVNQASIAWPAGFGDANPGDDSATAAANVPGANCQPPTVEQNIRILKKADPKCSKLADGNYECLYRITAINDGPLDYNGVFNFTDTLPPYVQFFDLGGTPPFNCTANVSGVVCNSKGNILLPKNGVPVVLENFGFEVSAPKTSTDRCLYLNSVQINAPLGKPWNAIATDDGSFATAVVDDPICNQAPPNGQTSDLELTKTADGPCVKGSDYFKCTYTITVTNKGPLEFDNSVEFDETVQATYVSVFYLNGKTVPCTFGNPAYHCVSDRIKMSVNQAEAFKVVLDVPFVYSSGEPICEVPNMAQITFPVGGKSNDNTNASNDGATAVAKTNNPYCLTVLPRQALVQPCPGQMARVGTQCKCPEGTRPGPNYTCDGHAEITPVPLPVPVPVPLTTPPPSDQCRRGEVEIDGQHCCPPGYFWEGRCLSLAPATTGPRPTILCRDGNIAVNGHCCPPPLVGLFPNCRSNTPQPPPPPVPRSCQPPLTGIWPLCHQPPNDQCPVGQSKTNGHCCPTGSVWDGKCYPVGNGNGGQGSGNPRKKPQTIFCIRGTHYDGTTCVPNGAPPNPLPLPGGGLIFKNFKLPGLQLPQ